MKSKNEISTISNEEITEIKNKLKKTTEQLDQYILINSNMQITVSSLTTENKNMESFYTNIVKDYNKRISSLEEIVLKMFSLE